MRCNALHRRRRRSRIRMTACKVKLTTSKSSSAAFPRTLSLKQQRWVDFTSKWTCGRNTHEHTHTHTQEHTQEHTHTRTHTQEHTHKNTREQSEGVCKVGASFLHDIEEVFNQAGVCFLRSPRQPELCAHTLQIGCVVFCPVGPVVMEVMAVDGVCE